MTMIKFNKPVDIRPRARVIPIRSRTLPVIHHPGVPERYGRTSDNRVSGGFGLVHGLLDVAPLGGVKKTRAEKMAARQSAIDARNTAKQTKQTARETQRTQKIAGREKQFKDKIAMKDARFDALAASKLHRFTTQQQLQAAKKAAREMNATLPTASGYEPDAILSTLPVGAMSTGIIPTSTPPFAPSGYDPNMQTQSIVPSAPTVSASSSSGYDPNAILEVFPPDAGSVNDPATNQLTGDNAMRERLLLVKQTNPEYYEFLAARLPDMSNVNSTMGDAAAPVTTAPVTTAPVVANESIWTQLIGRVSKEYADYQLKRKDQKAQTVAQTQDKLLAAQQSNAILLQNTESKKAMYIFGGLTLLGIAWLLTRKKH